MPTIDHVELIGSFPPPTAIWRSTKLTLAALGDSASLSVIRNTSLSYDTLEGTGIASYGIGNLPPWIAPAFNYAFPRLAYPSLVAREQAAVRESSIIHFQSEDLRPWLSHGRIAVTIHGNPLATISSSNFYTFSTAHRMAASWNLKRYSRFAAAMVHSSYVKEGLLDYGYSGRIDVIPDVLDPLFHPRPNKDSLRRTFNLPEDKTLLLSISTAEKRKNLPAINRLAELLPSHMRIVRVGPPTRGAITFPRLSDVATAELYAACDLLVMPSLEEGFGLPVIEAFGSGLPVVASDIPPIREAAGGAAVLVDPTSPASLLTGCRDALVRTQELAEKGLARAANFSVAQLRARLATFYSSI